MQQYFDLVDLVLSKGTRRENRTGIDTIGVFGAQARFNLQHGFPLLTTKKLHTRSIFYELLWFISGLTDIEYLQANKVRIWNEWQPEGSTDMGPIYGYQWRHWEGVDYKTKERVEVDQLAEVIDKLRNNPGDRRIILSAWQPAQIKDMSLPPCHCLFHFNTRVIPDEEKDKHPGKERYLSCLLYQRSCDLFLGVPFNIASYALLTHMVAQVTNTVPDEFIHTYGDLHIYTNHLDQIALQQSRQPRPLPKLKLNPEIKEITDFEYEDIEVLDYDPYPSIKGEVAV